MIPKIELNEVGTVEGKFDNDTRVYSEEGSGPTVRVATPPMIESVGELDIPGWHRHAKEVVGTNGVAPCISTQSNNLKTKIMYEGELDDSKFQGSRRVVSPDGVSPTITAEHEGPNFTKVMIDDEDSGKTE